MKKCIVFEVPAGFVYAERQELGGYTVVDAANSVDNAQDVAGLSGSNQVPSVVIYEGIAWVGLAGDVGSRTGPFKVVLQYEEWPA